MTRGNEWGTVNRKFTGAGMDLFELMVKGEDPAEKALDRLEGIVARFEADDPSEQDEALERALVLAEREWGSYASALEALADRKAKRAADPVGGEAEAERLRLEANEPGLIIRALRTERRLSREDAQERDAIIAQYGSLEAAIQPTPIEAMFIAATRTLCAEEDSIWAPILDWVGDGAVPRDLELALAAACPLPESITDAHAEALVWRDRARERGILCGASISGNLPIACQARRVLVEACWGSLLPAKSLAEFEIRLGYWAGWGGGQSPGYLALLEDFRRLSSDGTLFVAQEGTKEKARRLKTENPNWSLARIGKELGISRQAVHKHLRG